MFQNSKSPGSLEPLARTTGRHVPINIIDSSGNIVQPYAAETEATRRGNSSIPSAESGMVLWDKDSPPPSTLFDFNRTWNTLSSCDERWRYLSVRHDPFNLLTLHIVYLDNRAIHITKVMSNVA